MYHMRKREKKRHCIIRISSAKKDTQKKTTTTQRIDRSRGWQRWIELDQLRRFRNTGKDNRQRRWLFRRQKTKHFLPRVIFAEIFSVFQGLGKTLMCRFGKKNHYKSINQSINQSITRSLNVSTTSINQSINQSINRSINHSITQCIDYFNQSINQSIEESKNYQNYTRSVALCRKWLKIDFRRTWHCRQNAEASKYEQWQDSKAMPQFHDERHTWI